MTYTTKKVWSGSEVLTSADMNTYVGSNIEHIYDNCPNTQGFFNKGTTFVSQLNQRIESGIEDTLYTTAAYGSTAVTFNTAFGTAPRVVVTPAWSTIGYIKNVGTGGFDLHTQVTTGTYSGTITAHWIAIGA